MVRRPINGGVEVAVRVDELLERPIQRIGIGRGHRIEQELVGERGIRVCRTVAVEKCLVEEPMYLFECRFHPETRAEGLQTLHCERVAVGQRHIGAAQNVGHAAHAFRVERVACVELFGLRLHAWEGVLVHLPRARRHMGYATGGETGDEALGEQRKVCQRQESAVALPERHPALPIELGAPQVLEVAHNGAGEEFLQILRSLPSVHIRHGV